MVRGCPATLGDQEPNHRWESSSYRVPHTSTIQMLSQVSQRLIKIVRTFGTDVTLLKQVLKQVSISYSYCPSDYVMEICLGTMLE
jgi:hypothetical protein